VNVRWDVLSGGLCLELSSGRCSDKQSEFQHERLPKGSLRIADLGYFSLKVLKEMSESETYWLTRVKSLCVLYVNNERYELADFLRKQKSDKVEVEILLGAKDKLPLELCDWIVLATNASQEMMSLQEALVLARLRWQIELLFKLWKSHGKISEWRSDKPWRILCEVYAKLIGMIIQNWILLASGWCFGKKSLTQAAKAVRKHVVNFALAFAHSGSKRVELLKEALSGIKRCIEFGCKMNTRKKKPSTYQLLLALELEA